MRRIYLAGGIFGLTDAACSGWRDEARRLLGRGYEVLDPMRRDCRGREDTCAVEIVESDLADIAAADAVLANCARPSWGTAMEIKSASDLRVLVFGFCHLGRVSPWLRFHVDSLHDSLEAAVAAVRLEVAP